MRAGRTGGPYRPHRPPSASIRFVQNESTVMTKLSLLLAAVLLSGAAQATEVRTAPAPDRTTGGTIGNLPKFCPMGKTVKPIYNEKGQIVAFECV